MSVSCWSVILSLINCFIYKKDLFCCASLSLYFLELPCRLRDLHGFFVPLVLHALCPRCNIHVHKPIEPGRWVPNYPFISFHCTFCLIWSSIFFKKFSWFPFVFLILLWLFSLCFDGKMALKMWWSWLLEHQSLWSRSKS